MATQKRGLKDIKMNNLRLILQTILENEDLSRIEIAQKTGLSPSTVTVLVSELLQSGVINESSVHITTAGRSRVALSVSRDYGRIAVVEIGRTGSSLYLYDMVLENHCEHCISDHYLTGNTLFAEITAAISDEMERDGVPLEKLRGIGLLFQEDMNSSEFHVMYSTGFSSASISLREALLTQFRIPVVEEYCQVYTMTQALNGLKRDAKTSNYAHIAIGSNIAVSITLQGKPVTLHDGLCTDVTPLVSGLYEDLLPQTKQLLSKINGTSTALQPSVFKTPENPLYKFTCRLSGFISGLCILFPINTVFVSGKLMQIKTFEQLLGEQIKTKLTTRDVPEIVFLQPEKRDLAHLMASKLQPRVLCADNLHF